MILPSDIIAEKLALARKKTNMGDMISPELYNYLRVQAIIEYLDEQYEGSKKVEIDSNGNLENEIDPASKYEKEYVAQVIEDILQEHLNCDTHEQWYLDLLENLVLYVTDARKVLYTIASQIDNPTFKESGRLKLISKILIANGVKQPTSISTKNYKKHL